MFHLAVARFAASGASVLQSLSAITDTVLTTRNNNFIVTDDFRLILAYGLGSVISELRANWPTINAFGFHQFWPYDLQGTTLSTVPDRPALIDYTSQPLQVPDNEELNIQVSCTPATTENDILAMWLATPGHNLLIPTGVQRLTIRATYAITTAAAYAWSGGSALTFPNNFRGGWYWVVGLAVQDAGTLLARLIFPKGQPYQGRVLRPGCIVQQTIANRPADRFMGRMGAWGYFNSFETPLIEIFSTTAAAHTGEVRLDLVYMGDAQPPPGMA